MYFKLCSSFEKQILLCCLVVLMWILFFPGLLYFFNIIQNIDMGVSIFGAASICLLMIIITIFGTIQTKNKPYPVGIFIDKKNELLNITLSSKQKYTVEFSKIENLTVDIKEIYTGRHFYTKIILNINLLNGECITFSDVNPMKALIDVLDQLHINFPVTYMNDSKTFIDKYVNFNYKNGKYLANKASIYYIVIFITIVIIFFGPTILKVFSLM